MTVLEELSERGVPFERMRHAKSFSSLEEAEILGLDPSEVLKVVVLDTDQGHALAVVPGDHRLDMRLVERAVNDRNAHLADEDELRTEFPDIELGAFPPLGSAIGAKTLVDPEVMEHETAVFAAGRTSESVRVRTDELFRGEQIEITPVARHPEEEAR
jgi:Ala-tRNA(Pro) deacylase